MSFRQLTLDLGHRPALGGEDFLVAGSNSEALGWLDRWPEWPNPALVVHGPAGCGKTHLAHVFAARSGAPVLAAAGLQRTDPPRLLAAVRALVIEDADQGVDEVALFHLYNLVKESGATLLLTARLPSGRWPVTLPDLASRLKAAPNVAIHAPDDMLMAGLLVKLFADRQLRVSQELVAYLLPRLERSFEALRDTVARLDAAALAERREITVPLARRILEES